MRKKQRVVYYDYPLNTEVPVIEYGPFAIHRPLDWDATGRRVNAWTVTHASTGRCFGYMTAAQARHLVRDLARLPIDWNGITNENYRETWTPVKHMAIAVAAKLGIKVTP